MKIGKGNEMEKTYTVIVGYGNWAGEFIVDEEENEDTINEIAWDIAKEWLAENIWVEEKEN